MLQQGFIRKEEKEIISTYYIQFLLMAFRDPERRREKKERLFNN